MAFLWKQLALASLASVANAGLVLDSFNPCAAGGPKDGLTLAGGESFKYCDSAKNSLPFRGVKPGDIWGPPIPGSNKLMCGTEQIGKGSTFPGTPLSIQAGSRFDLYFNISRPMRSKTGTVRVQLKYGATASFAFNNGWDIYAENGSDNTKLDIAGTDQAKAAECNLPDDDIDDRQCHVAFHLQLDMPAKGAGGYTGKALMQVEFLSDAETDQKKADATDAAQVESVTYYQCIDLDVTNGDVMPEVGPWGVGDPSKDVSVTSKARSLNPIVDDDGPSVLEIVLLTVVIVLLCCFICIWLKYKSDKQKQSEEKFPPQLALAEKVQDAPEPVSKEKEPTPPSPVEQPAPEPEPEPPADPEPVAPEKVEKNDGSSGRHYHFRYIDDEEDK